VWNGKKKESTGYTLIIAIQKYVCFGGSVYPTPKRPSRRWFGEQTFNFFFKGLGFSGAKVK
jgi:hypothetical protein